MKLFYASKCRDSVSLGIVSKTGRPEFYYMMNEGNEINEHKAVPREQTHGPARLIHIMIPVFCFLVTTVFLASALNPFLPVKTFLLQLTVVGGLLVWAYEALLEGRLRVVRTPVDIFLIIFLLWIGITGLYAANRPLWLEQLTLQLCGAALFYFIVFYFRDSLAVEKLIFYMLIPVFVVGALAIFDLKAMSFFPWDLLLVNNHYSVFKLLGVDGTVPGTWDGNFDGRVSASFGNPVYLAGWVVLMLPAAWSVYKSSESPVRRTVSLAAVVVLLFLLIVTFTRSAWGSALISLAVYRLLTRRRRHSRCAEPSRQLGTVVIVIALIFFALMFAKKGVFNPNFSIAGRLSSIVKTGDESQLQRALIWKTTWETIKDNPLKGVGLGNYQVFHPWYQTQFFKDGFWREYVSFPERVHNEYMELTAETGVPGLILYIALIAAIIRTGFKALSSEGRRGELATGILSGFVALLLYALFQFPMHIVPVHSYFWIMAGALVVLGHGDSLCPSLIVIRTPGRSREKVIAMVTFTVMFLLCAWSLFTPTLGHISFFRGIRAENTDDINRAARLMENGIASNPGSREMYIRYGAKLNAFADSTQGTWERKMLLEKARNMSIQGMKYHPYEERLYLNAGAASISLGEPEKARLMLEYATVLNPSDPVAIYNLGIAYYMMSMYNNAKYIYGKSIETGTVVPGAYLNLGRVHSALGEHKEALEAYRKALEEQGVSGDVYYSMGLSYSAMGNREEAVSCYRKALAADPDNMDALGNLGIEKLESGDYDGALRDLGKVLGSRPDSGIAMYHIGRAYYRMGNMNAAETWLKNAAVELPGHEGINKLLNSIVRKGISE